MLSRKGLNNGLLTLATVGVVTVLLNRISDGDGTATPGHNDAVRRPDPPCTLAPDGGVRSGSGDYRACVSDWLFMVDPRTGPGTRPDGRQFTEAYRTSGSVPRCYTPPHPADDLRTGECFRITEARLRRLALPFTDFHTVSLDNVAEFVFVTGISDSHYVESLDAIASVQKFMPEHQILVYDLGLTSDQVEQMKRYCRVKVIEFNVKDRSLYPSHVQNLATFAFKPLIIMDALRSYGSVVWLDSSVRLHRSLDSYYPEIVSSGGIYLFAPPPKRSVVHHTHPSLYRFFPSNLTRLRHTMILMPDGYYSRTEPLFWNALWWWALCALTERCISPCRLQPCSNFTADNVLDYIGCHRYDMSAINVLLANYHGYDYFVYGSKRDIKSFEKLRRNTTFYRLQTC